MENLGIPALFLLMLMSIVSPTHVTALSGIFNISSTKAGKSFRCHECLVRSFSITQIHLLESTNAFKLYWVEGHSDMLSIFLAYCLSDDICRLSNQLQHTYSPADTIQIRRDKTETNDNVGIHSLANLMHEEMVKESEGLATAEIQWKHGISPFLTKISSEIPIFYWNDYMNRKVTLRKQSGKIQPDVLIWSTPAALNSEMRHQDRVGKSMRCILIRSNLYEAVCRECLAMHSKWFTVQSFHLYHQSRERLTELYVFFSNYESSHIVANCDSRFCPDVGTLELRDCRRITSIFLINHPTVQEENKMTLKEVKEVLANIADKRMARYHSVKWRLQTMILSPGNLNILHAEKYVCIKLRGKWESKWRCVRCVLKDVVGIRFVVVLSLYSSLILTDTVNPEKLLQCGQCRVIEVVQPDDCLKAVARTFENLEKHQKPSHLEMYTELDKSCLAVYYPKADTIKCHSCLSLHLDMKDGTQLIKRSPSLLDISNRDSRKTPEEFRKLLTDCVSLSSCVRIQRVPYDFCTAHREFMMTPSRERTKDNKFKQNSIPVGLWPPLERRIARSANNFNYPEISVPISEKTYDPRIWLASNNIAFVQFRYAHNKAHNCLKCLVEHAEVFFFYRSELALNGYVWMCPVPSSILSLCVGDHCTSLSHDEYGIKMRRPVGLRQVTNDDVKISLAFSKQ